jgi:hypothetical protein
VDQIRDWYSGAVAEFVHWVIALSTVANGAYVRHPRNTLSDVGNIALQSTANLAEDREGQISFTPLDSAEVSPVQPTILRETVLAKPAHLPFGLNPAPQP